MGYSLNFENQLRQTVSEWCVIQKLIRDNAIIQSWLDALVARDKAYSQIGQNLLNQHYCTCYQKKSDSSLNSTSTKQSPLLEASQIDKDALKWEKEVDCILEPDQEDAEVSECNKEVEKKLNFHKSTNVSSQHKVSEDHLVEESKVPRVVSEPSEHSSNKSEDAEGSAAPTNGKKTMDSKQVNKSKLGEPVLENSNGDHLSSNQSSKQRKYSIRLDVVKKTIFRCLKKFYNSEWKKHWMKPVKDSDVVLEEAEKYITKTFSGAKTGDMPLFLIAMVDNKKKFLNENKRYCQLRDQISSMMTSFNKNKIDALMKHQSFSNLVRYFLSQPIEVILADKKDPEITKIYTGQIDEIKQSCLPIL